MPWAFFDSPDATYLTRRSCFQSTRKNGFKTDLCTFNGWLIPVVALVKHLTSQGQGEVGPNTQTHREVKPPAPTRLQSAGRIRKAGQSRQPKMQVNVIEVSRTAKNCLIRFKNTVSTTPATLRLESKENPLKPSGSSICYPA